MGTVVELVILVGVTVAIALSHGRRWTSIIALTLATLLFAIAVLSVLNHMTYFAMRSATFAIVLASATATRWPTVGLSAGVGGALLAVLAAVWLAATGGTITMVTGESVDPSQRAVITTTTDATAGFLVTIVLGVSVAGAAVFWRGGNAPEVLDK
jgi:hypothetical protein